ncbi:hypothetical protein [Lentzea sp. NPDC003310]|uniref:hypothetical protein n=1 Tax=Lentzea sp. NPDC003310 TaxID=3154447 RepID=UPI0033ACCABB
MIMASLRDHLNYEMGPYSGLIGWAFEYFYSRRDRLFDGRAQPVAVVSFDGKVTPVGQFRSALGSDSIRLLLPVEINAMNTHTREIDHGDIGLSVITSVPRPGSSFAIPLVIGREQPIELERGLYATATFVCRRGDLYSRKDPVIGVYGSRVLVTGAGEIERLQYVYPRGRQDWPSANTFESKPDFVSEKCDLCRHYVHSIDCPLRLRQIYCGRCSEVFASVEAHRQHLKSSHGGFKWLLRRWS